MEPARCISPDVCLTVPFFLHAYEEEQMKDDG